mmetsp:Transcript_21564/g.45110  ORF Transcript_21564/g.45110 Transcript_21564/m.45110 type:complete len:101 (+) Transcript_21564:190-492(+)
METMLGVFVRSRLRANAICSSSFYQDANSVQSLVPIKNYSRQSFHRTATFPPIFGFQPFSGHDGCFYRSNASKDSNGRMQDVEPRLYPDQLLQIIRPPRK